MEEEEVPTQPFDVTDDVGAFAESHDVGDDAGMGGGEWDDDNENTMQVSPFKPSHPVDHPTQVLSIYRPTINRSIDLSIYRSVYLSICPTHRHSGKRVPLLYSAVARGFA